jgi:hypothetical protein
MLRVAVGVGKFDRIVCAWASPPVRTERTWLRLRRVEPFEMPEKEPQFQDR